ncbi:Methionine aminopeptidase 2 [Meloidogyne graminicola]|uniref:Methionine aminopeptidase 2 n=1 Tax=Meloidogyne graminicola TaxID=189291 RepID=A0A8S9ZNU5_9BILA|nr:Methionine aminopeptidase 2 [Meloidogyne graminicola]
MKQLQSKKGKRKGGKNSKEVVANEIDEGNLEDGTNDTTDGNEIKSMLPQNWTSEINEMKTIDQQFVEGNYPIGQICDYRIDDRKAINRLTNEEKKALDTSYEDIYKDFRRAAESHRQTRKYRTT